MGPFPPSHNNFYVPVVVEYVSMCVNRSSPQRLIQRLSVSLLLDLIAQGCKRGVN